MSTPQTIEVSYIESGHDLLASVGKIAHSLLQAQSCLRFEVCDTGVGIASDHIDRVFDLYWQGKQTQQSGVGLGLAITKGDCRSPWWDHLGGK